MAMLHAVLNGNKSASDNGMTRDISDEDQIMKKPPNVLHPAVRHFALLSVVILSACATTTPQWDQQFGQSVRQTRSQQTLHVQAGGDAPVSGVDGVVARDAIGRYRSSFREPPPAPAPLIMGQGR